MNHIYHRRYSFWYERIIFSILFQFTFGFLCVVFLPSLFYWHSEFISANYSSVSIYTSSANAVAYIAVFSIIRRLRKFPGTQSISYILPTLALTWLIVVAILFFFRFEYSRFVLGVSYLIVNFWAIVIFQIRKKYKKLKLALVPLGRATLLKNGVEANVNVLDKPDLAGRRYDGVVADLHSPDLSPDWEKFLARCTLSRIPVFHYKQIQEALTGRVKIDHLAENEFGVLLPSPFYEFLKRLLDISLVLASAPIWIPVIFITGIVIKIESRGPVFFTQERVGRANRSFIVYKLRSMCQDSEKYGAQFATAGDMRVTRVGRFIRKTRIDELPQFLNVLKGDMSLIGPRPEQRIFVDQFEQEIPFYAYRHVVRPGITGWAQVVHGYAADADDTRVKIEHDFYYIKHLSLWLDLLIIFKTIRTIVTGFGAR